MVRALDAHPAKPSEFVAGTDGCDVWEVDSDPRVLVEGHSGHVQQCACHPHFHSTFATVDESKAVMLWDMETRALVRCADVGIAAVAVGFS